MAHPRSPLLALMLALLTGCGSPPPAVSPEAAAESADRAAPESAPETPRRYTVQRGDTLWDIARHFFDDPWRWPGIWARNEQVENPHLIFPGDTLVLRAGRLELERGLAVTRLSPEVRDEPLPPAIPAVDPERIAVFLRHAGLVRPEEWEEAPRVVAAEEERLMVGSPGQRVFVRGGAPAGELRLASRGEPVTHPETGEPLAHWLQPVAEGRRVAAGDPATVRLRSVQRPVRGGERVLRVPEPEVPRQLRAAPDSSAMEVVALPGRLSHAGTHDTVVLHGIRPRQGAIYRLRRPGRSVRDPADGARVQLPARDVAWAVVYRVHADLALALLVRAEEAVVVGDRAVAPS